MDLNVKIESIGLTRAITIAEMESDKVYFIAENYNTTFRMGTPVMKRDELAHFDNNHSLMLILGQRGIEKEPFPLLDPNFKVIPHEVLDEDGYYDGPIIGFRIKTLGELYAKGGIQYAEESYRFRRRLEPMSGIDIAVVDEELKSPGLWVEYNREVVEGNPDVTLEEYKRLLGIYVVPTEFVGDFKFFNEHFKVIDFNSYDGKRYNRAPNGRPCTSISEFYIGERRMPSGTIVQRLDPVVVRALAQHPINDIGEKDIVVSWLLGDEYGLATLDKELTGSFIDLRDMSNPNHSEIVLARHHRHADNVEFLHLDELFAGNYYGIYLGSHSLRFEMTNKRCQLVYQTPFNNLSIKFPMEFVDYRQLRFDPSIKEKVEAFLNKNAKKENVGLKKSSIFD